MTVKTHKSNRPRKTIRIDEFWKPIEECPKAYDKYYLLRHIHGIVAAKWWTDDPDGDCWISQFRKYDPEHVTHFAEIPPLPKRGE